MPRNILANASILYRARLGCPGVFSLRSCRLDDVEAMVAQSYPEQLAELEQFVRRVVGISGETKCHPERESVRTLLPGILRSPDCRLFIDTEDLVLIGLRDLAKRFLDGISFDWETCPS